MFPFAYYPQDLKSSFNFCQPSYQYSWLYPQSQYGNFTNNHWYQFSTIKFELIRPETQNQHNIIKIAEKTSDTQQKSQQIEQTEMPTSLDNNQYGISKTSGTKLNKWKKKKNKKSKIFKKGHWTNKEQRLYQQFIEDHKEIMSDSDQKKMQKIFKQMSDFIKSRSASQCRSHHQKFDPKELSNWKNSRQFKIANE
ncbi:unnamed protein product [Paramecium sonneborni]|uniref:Myb-like domain-containing protein n=1 Tax=Paramecium sonneborni TaxID=65129 RepID=A0A8S1RBE2_9CILI|nr:unnamed protein product [Paramecium sonneborni]